jgi:hypothetical protein
MGIVAVGTPDEICEMLAALNNAGAEYVLLAISGGNEQLYRFAREIMPSFSSERSAPPQPAPPQ